MSVGKPRILAVVSVAVLFCLAARGVFASEKQQKKATPRPHQSHVVVQSNTAANTSQQDVSNAVRKAMEGELKKMPKPVREAIEREVKTIHVMVDQKTPGSKPIVSARQLELKIAAPNKKIVGVHTKSAASKPRVIVMQVDKDGKKSIMAGEVVVMAKAAESGDHKKGTALAYTVEVKGNLILLNGKPMMTIPKACHHADRNAKKEKPATRSIKRHINVRLQQQAKTKKEENERHMIWVDKDGNKHELKVNVVVQTTPDGKTVVTANTTPKSAKTAVPKPRIRARAARVDVHHKPIAAKVQMAPRGHMQIHRVESKKASAEAKTYHRQVIQELHAIQVELRNIRVQLEKMNRK